MAYYLMADNRRRMPSSAYLKEEMTEATDVNLQYPSGKRGCWRWVCFFTLGRIHLVGGGAGHCFGLVQEEMR